MSEKTQLMLMMVIIPWLFLIYFGGPLYTHGLLMQATLLTVACSLLNGLIGRRIGERE